MCVTKSFKNQWHKLWLETRYTSLPEPSWRTRRISIGTTVSGFSMTKLRDNRECRRRGTGHSRVHKGVSLILQHRRPVGLR